MLSVKEYMQKTFECVKIQGQLEELRRIQDLVPLNATIQQRETKLNRELDKLRKKLDTEFTPVELAPIEQYIELEYIPVR